MLNKTRGIVLRSVKYGETSLVITMFTELFGLQSYLVNGVRQASKKGGSKAVFFQPSALLELVAYHNEFKNLQRLREYRWAHLYNNIFSDVHKNAVALYMIELLTKCLKQPEANPDLFYFMEDALIHLDGADAAVTANMPLYFSVHLAVFFGFRISDEGSQFEVLDLQEGGFRKDVPNHSHYLQGKEAEAVAHILKVLHPSELNEVSLNRETRRRIIQGMEEYYAFHVPEFGSLRSLPVLRELMG